MGQNTRLKTIVVHGHAYFVTTRVHEGLPIFYCPNLCQIIINGLNFYRQAKQSNLLGYVIMPTHLHYIFWPYGKYSIIEILRDFKKQTAKDIIKELKKIKQGGWINNPIQMDKGGITNPTSPEWAQGMLNLFFHNSIKQEYKVWQSNNWVTNIYSESFLITKLNYIRQNPVKAGFVRQETDYVFSSARNYYFNDNSLIKIDHHEI
ncbi:transposase [Patescibacteria group bacterium]|nr:transposase [Patescibacteria group bacterium]MBU0964671.1 transposase [Patescibacteria group bacterium]